jgi:competence protein ComGC
MSEPEKKSSEIRIGVWVFVCLFAGVVLMAIAIPNFIKAHSTSAGNACINNLRQIDAAANQFALEHNLTNGAPINFPDDLTPYIKLNSAGKIPSCPQGGIYHISKVGETPTCSLGTTVTSAHVLPP